MPNCLPMASLTATDGQRARKKAPRAAMAGRGPDCTATRPRRLEKAPTDFSDRFETRAAAEFDKSDLAGRLTYHARDPSTPFESATFDPPVSSICFFVSAFWKTV